ncbi:DUF2290 domain-containing protein [Aggregatibacter aphrophilus]|uniref:Uncharacterized protein n=1 Tax=Aggregatibacter aphrophilus TaxID=732 RepID=A0ABX9VYH5_AGGAP|nr:DUF2290 domain-containing protein [Aggregatibacter aphrophilus]RMW91379.1 hypothetical protein DOL88_01230 [Aggregatibacter aphrophilus]
MLYLDIKKEISELTTALIKVGICDDQNFPADHSLGNDIYEVTFSGEGDISSIFDFYEYETAYEEIVKNRAFNMKLIDGALIQLMYKVSKRDSKNCRIPISHPMTPHWFIDFILRNFYQTKKYNFISELPKKRFSVPLSISDNERNIIHMVVPE